MRHIPVMIITVLTAVVLSAPPRLHAVEVRDLRCEYQEKPLGIDAVKPRLGWKIEVGDRKSEVRGLKSGARIVDAKASALSNVEGVKFLRVENGSAVYAVGSGVYKFVSEIGDN